MGVEGLGYWCRTSMAGQGYASEAVAALIEHAFRDLAFVEVERVAFPASPEWGDAATVLFMRRRR
jgi:RimJ/RimL family protein N-acetyltransferase